MDQMAEFLARHPALTGAAFAALTGLCAYNTFRAGMAYAGLRVAVAARAYDASQALGG